jgi:hypothetical protein
LAELDVRDWRAEMQFDMEPTLGDARLAYLALAPASIVGDLLGE